MRTAKFYRRAILAIGGLLFGVISFAQAMEPTNPAKTGTKLGIEGDRFTLNGEKAFLLGISYYGGLGASDDSIRSDLDELQRFGFNWLRVWATWDSYGENVSAVDDAGNAREFYRNRLQSLVAECDRRKMVVDVTLARSRRSNKSGASVHLPDFQSHQRAVRVIIETLKSHQNWYLDLANERDVGDERFVSVEELKQLRQIARDLNSQLLVTASFGGHDLSNSDIRDALQSAGNDFLAVHRPRHPDSPRQTESRTREILKQLTLMKISAPVHHQEPFRRGYTDWEPVANDFLVDLQGALSGGAAGWCFHNGGTKTGLDGQPRRSFDLRQKRLIEQLDAEEVKALHRARSILPNANNVR